MNLLVDIDLQQLSPLIRYGDKILLTGSCFTEHIGNALAGLKYNVLQNPNGILFDPASVCKSLVSYVNGTRYTTDDLFELNEVWQSWQHHSRFSNINKEECIKNINHSQLQAQAFLKDADWLIITLGSSFSYRLKEKDNGNGSVANCHRAPAQWFNKHLLETDETIALLDNCYHQLMRFNPGLQIIFTISPVRHLRDGVVENNRSKARLIEAVHHLVNKFSGLHYFPAYELVIDVLRDYRFYDIDLAHPNYLATEYVLEKFAETCIDPTSQELMKEIKKIAIARKHKAFQPATNAHRQFLQSYYDKTKTLQEKHPFLDLSEELSYFDQAPDIL